MESYSQLVPEVVSHLESDSVFPAVVAPHYAIGVGKAHCGPVVGVGAAGAERERVAVAEG